MARQLGLSTVITIILLYLFGSTVLQSPGVQLTGPAAAVFTLIGIFIFYHYPQEEVAS